MLKVGLTGGIATGKSHVVARLRELGCEVLDADVIARQVVEPGQPAYDEIVSAFGREILETRGAIDRARLGAVVFANSDDRQRLNAIVHPRVIAAQECWLAKVAARSPEAIAIVDAPLLIEAGMHQHFDKVVIVFCEPGLQLERLMARNQLSGEEALARIAAQMPTAEKLKYADYTINTSGDFADTDRQVSALYAELRKQPSAPS
jgi:dephospho-CoA kinase